MVWFVFVCVNLRWHMDDYKFVLNEIIDFILSFCVKKLIYKNKMNKKGFRRLEIA